SAPGSMALVCEALEPYALHFFTTRTWKLGERNPDPADAWRDVAVAAKIDAGHLARLHQVHGAEAVTYKKGGRGPAGPPAPGDIVLTDDRELAIVVGTADCLPILIANTRSRAVAAAHAGWRGLAARVPEVAVARLLADFGGAPEDLVVAVGPAIGACCYEV